MAVPARTGDRTGDCGEASERLPFPVKAFGQHGHTMKGSIVLAQEHRAGTQITAKFRWRGSEPRPGSAMRLSGSCMLLAFERRGENTAGPRIKVANLRNLLAPHQDTDHERAREIARWGSPHNTAPAPAQQIAFEMFKVETIFLGHFGSR